LDLNAFNVRGWGDGAPTSLIYFSGAAPGVDPVSTIEDFRIECDPLIVYRACISYIDPYAAPWYVTTTYNLPDPSPLMDAAILAAGVALWWKFAYTFHDTGQTARIKLYDGLNNLLHEYTPPPYLYGATEDLLIDANYSGPQTGFYVVLEDDSGYASLTASYHVVALNQDALCW
jgi:hypothetical protein